MTAPTAITDADLARELIAESDAGESLRWYLDGAAANDSDHQARRVARQLLAGERCWVCAHRETDENGPTQWDEATGEYRHEQCLDVQR